MPSLRVLSRPAGFVRRGSVNGSRFAVRRSRFVRGVETQTICLQSVLYDGWDLCVRAGPLGHGWDVRTPAQSLDSQLVEAKEVSDASNFGLASEARSRISTVNREQ